MKNSKCNMCDGRWKLIFYLLSFIFYLGTANAQFTTDKDTLLILTGDSTTVSDYTYNSRADTSGGTPYTGYTAGYDLNGKILVGIDFDTTAAWTSAKFLIQTSATKNPYNWRVVNYEGDIYTFTPEVKSINNFKPQVIYALKRYIRIICLTSAGGYENEARRRKMVPLIKSGF